MTLRQRLFSDSLKQRKDAFCELLKQGSVPDSERIELLRELVRKETDPELRPAARKYLDHFLEQNLESREEGEEVTIPLKNRVNVTEDVLADGTPVQKVEFLKEMLEGRRSLSRAEIEASLDREDDVFVTATLVSCLGKVVEPGSTGRLCGFLTHWNSRVRANAVEALMQVDDEQTYDKVFALFSDEDPRVKANVSRFFVRIRPEKALKTLGEMIESDNRFLIESALFALRGMEQAHVYDLMRKAEKKLSTITSEPPWLKAFSMGAFRF